MKNSIMFSVCVVLIVSFSVKLSQGEQISLFNSSVSDKAFESLKRSLYCAPSGSYVFYQSKGGWLTFDHETLPDKYNLPKCDVCPPCDEENCFACSPRALDSSCEEKCDPNKPLPLPPQTLRSRSLCILSRCTYRPDRVLVQPTFGHSFGWLGWVKGVSKGVIHVAKEVAVDVVDAVKEVICTAVNNNCRQTKYPRQPINVVGVVVPDSLEY